MPPTEPIDLRSASSPARGIPQLLAVASLWLLTAGGCAAATLVRLDETTYQTEHCLFVVDSSVTWATPSTAYAEIYGSPFTRLSSAFAKLTALFPADYFSICYLANTGFNLTPNYINGTYKATGISTGPGSSGIGNGNPSAAQSFATVDFCRYNLEGPLFGPVLPVFDHELGHAWGCQFFNNVSGVGPGILSNGHWLPNTTIDCQMSARHSSDGGTTVNKIYGDPTTGFRYQRVDNLHSNDRQVYADQTLYLLGASERFPTTYALNSPVYHADGTVGYSSVETYDHAAAVARYGVRNPSYRTSPKRFRLGFVYIARDAAEVMAVHDAVERSVVQFCNGEAIDPEGHRFQTPFLVCTHFRGSVDGRLADLDGTPTPTLTIANAYVASSDGSAVIGFSASGRGGPAPAVTVLPASTQCSVSGSTVSITELPDGVHFFTLKAANAAGKSTFGHFVVEVQRPAAGIGLASQPANQTVVAGTTASFTVVVTGGPGTLTYQWFRQAKSTSTWNRIADSGAYAGANSATLSVVSSTTMNGDRLLCMVTGSTGAVTSSSATLVVNETVPNLVRQPASTVVAAGNVATFSVAAGGVPLTFGYSYYQWERQAGGSGLWIPLTDSAGVVVGSQTASLSVYGTTVGMTGDQYRCVVSNTSGSSISGAATIAVIQRPTVASQPANVSASAGQTVSFSVTANGTGPLAYQWFLYSSPIAGATGPTFTLANVQLTDAGSYGVQITNAGGTAWSNYASLEVAAILPAITSPPQGRTVSIDSPVTFSVAASGSAPLVYAWSKNGTVISGANSTTYSIANARISDAGSYTVTVTNPAGTVTSAAAVLVVNALPPSILTQPQSASVAAGVGVTFSAVATGTPPLTFQWFRNAVPILGATDSSYRLVSPGAADAGSYAVTVTNSAGTAISEPAALTVVVPEIGPTAWLSNLSVRATLETGQQLILGFSTHGSRIILLRGAGPALTALGVGLDGHPDPTLRVFDAAGRQIDQNDNWNPALATTFAEQGAFNFPDGSLDSALLAKVADLNTAIVSGRGRGVVLMELYDTQTARSNRIVNMSARSFVGTSENALIAGFVIAGSGSKRLLIRGVGPTLAQFGVAGTLAHPLLEVYDSTGSKLFENDHWSPDLSSAFVQVGAFSLGTGSKDAALLVSLTAGAYSVKITGANGSTGEGLVEIYEVYP
ncbi:MAG: immunoglobulin domain-containing protein [Opitutaceae bacterium]